MVQSYGKARESDWWKARAMLSSHSGPHLLRFTDYWSQHHPHWWRIKPVLLSFQPFVLFHYKHCTHIARGVKSKSHQLFIFFFFLPHTFKGYATFEISVVNQFKREKVNAVNFKTHITVNIPSWHEFCIQVDIIHKVYMFDKIKTKTHWRIKELNFFLLKLNYV